MLSDPDVLEERRTIEVVEGTSRRAGDILEKDADRTDSSLERKYSEGPTYIL